MRWRQVKNPETGKYEMIPLDKAAEMRDAQHGIIVRGNFDAFRSHVDGSIIRNGREMIEHCKKHNVVPVEEFDEAHYERKRRERERFFQGESSRQEQFRRRQEIHETICRLERNA